MFSFDPMTPVLLVRHSLFGLDPAELHATPHIFVYILNVCKFFIWRSRNDFRFRGVQPGAVSVIESVKARVKFNLPFFSSRSSPLAVDAIFIVSGVPVVQLLPFPMVSLLSLCNFVCCGYCVLWCWVSLVGALHSGLYHLCFIYFWCCIVLCLSWFCFVQLCSCLFMSVLCVVFLLGLGWV